jgi:hypothetical protein
MADEMSAVNSTINWQNSHTDGKQTTATAHTISHRFPDNVTGYLAQVLSP